MKYLELITESFGIHKLSTNKCVLPEMMEQGARPAMNPELPEWVFYHQKIENKAGSKVLIMVHIQFYLKNRIT